MSEQAGSQPEEYQLCWKRLSSVCGCLAENELTVLRAMQTQSLEVLQTSADSFHWPDLGLVIVLLWEEHFHRQLYFQPTFWSFSFIYIYREREIYILLFLCINLMMNQSLKKWLLVPYNRNIVGDTLYYTFFLETYTDNNAKQST